MAAAIALLAALVAQRLIVHSRALSIESAVITIASRTGQMRLRQQRLSREIEVAEASLVAHALAAAVVVA